MRQAETIIPFDGHQRETLRRKFRPDSLRLLFVGESPPASGRFFYRCDSGLYRAMRDAFRDASLTAPTRINEDNFLASFQASGCYLIDLCRDPVDRLDAASRRSVCRAHEAPLAETLAKLQPAMTATLVRSIERNVLRAASAAKWHGPFVHLPYPGRCFSSRARFLSILTPHIQDLLRQK